MCEEDLVLLCSCWWLLPPPLSQAFFSSDKLLEQVVPCGGVVVLSASHLQGMGGLCNERLRYVNYIATLSFSCSLSLLDELPGLCLRWLGKKAAKSSHLCWLLLLRCLLRCLLLHCLLSAIPPPYALLRKVRLRKP